MQFSYVRAAVAASFLQQLKRIITVLHYRVVARCRALYFIGKTLCIERMTTFLREWYHSTDRRQRKEQIPTFVLSILYVRRTYTRILFVPLRTHDTVNMRMAVQSNREELWKGVLLFVCFTPCTVVELNIRVPYPHSPLTHQMLQLTINIPALWFA